MNQPEQPERTVPDANGEGLRILRADPGLLLWELLWRWSFGLGVLALLFIAYSHLRQTIVLTNAERTIFASHDPMAIANTVVALIVTWQPLLLRVAAQVGAAAAVLWVVAATPGRGLLTRLIARRLAGDYGVAIAPEAPRRVRYALLAVGRVLMLLILLIGYLAGVLIAAQVNPQSHVILIDSLILCASLAASVVLWSEVNWVLSLAPIFVARDGVPALDAVVAAIAFIRRNGSHLSAIALWNATVRGLAATAITLAGVATVVWRLAHPAWLTPALLALETVLYLVVSDLLLLARFAAYSSLALRELSLPEENEPAAEQPRSGRSQ